MNKKVYDWDQDHPHIKWLVSALVFLIAMVIGMVSVRGQFGVEQPMFAVPASGFVIPYSGSLYVNLDDADLANGQITVWTSRVTQVSFTNLVKGPIKEAAGLRFYVTNFLTVDPNAAPNIKSNAFCIVYQNKHGDPSAWKSILGNATAEDFLGLQTTYLFTDLLGGAGITWSGNMTSNVWVDIIFSGGTSPVLYTNGVQSVAGGLNNSADWNWRKIGANQAAGVDGWAGYVRKIFWWTNLPAGLTASDVANLHKEMTNTYSYSP